MLSSRLRSSCGVHPRFLCPSCSVHVTQASSRSIGRSGCGARAASATTTTPGLPRSYATDTAKDSAGETPSCDVEAEEKADAPSTSASANANANGTAANAEKKAPTKTKGGNKVANNGKNQALTKVDTKKTPKATPQKEKAQAQPANKAGHDTDQLLKETLAIMKELSGNPAMREIKQQLEAKGKRKGKRAAQKLADPELLADVQRQVSMMRGAMGVLKSVLTTQAEKRAQAEKNKKNPGTNPEKSAEQGADPEKAGASAQAAPQNKTPDKGAEEDKKQPPKKKDEQEKKPPKKKDEQEKKQPKKDEQEKKQPKRDEQEKKQPKKKEEPPQKEDAPSKTKKGQPLKETQQKEEGLGDKLVVESSNVKSAAKAKTDEKVSQGLAAVVANVKAKKSGHPSIRESVKSAKAKGGTSQAKSKEKKARKVEVEKFAASTGTLKPIDVKTPPVPLIQYGLDRVLFNEGVYALQDPRTRVWNFDPYLANIMPVTQFDFDALKEYITSSKDTLLMDVTKNNGKKYTGSTSSMTSTLAHFHYLLSAWRPINPVRMSRDFEPDSSSFTSILKAPAATILNYRDGAYAIDADKLWDRDTVLTMLGKSMEMLLTAPKAEYEKYRRSNSHKLTEAEKKQDESYHYTTFGDFMMRSQLDAYDPRLPGTGIYDLKTRAVVSIRMDALNYEKGVGYQIRTRTGQWESFEREYYDMIRSAFLKYSLQVRMGRMDGIFVAYHNTARIFGFQYIPLEEMDLAIHGDLDTTLGDQEFMASLTLWNKLLDEATARFPEKSLRIHVETRPSKTQMPFLYFFAEPVTDDEIREIQEKKKEDVDKFREQVLGIPPDGNAAAEGQLALEDDAAEDEAQANEEEAQEETEIENVEEEEDSEQVWGEMMDVIEETMENDAQGITAIRDAIEEALEQSGLLQAKSPEEAQHYVEALLKSIVDVDAEQAKGASESESEVEAEANDSDAVAADTTAPKKSSVFGLFSRWFGFSSAEAETPAKESPTPEEKPSSTPSKSDEPAGEDPVQQVASSTVESFSIDQSPTLPEDEGGAIDATKEAQSAPPSPDLVELIMKLTSRVGSSTPIAKPTREQSDDREKLQEFEKILIKMMPQPEDKGTRPDDEAEPEATTSQGQGKPTKDILGMVLSVRNVVNDQHVPRPDRLKLADKWDIEYSMEEITDKDKAHLLYKQVQTRRKAAHYREPDKVNPFFASFHRILKEKSRTGKSFRKEEDLLDMSQPAWVVGQREPFRPRQVFGTDLQVNLGNVMPNTAHKNWRGRPGNKLVSEAGILASLRTGRGSRPQVKPTPAQPNQADASSKGGQAGEGGGVADVEKPSPEAIAKSVAELRATRDPHFKPPGQEPQVGPESGSPKEST